METEIALEKFIIENIYDHNSITVITGKYENNLFVYLILNISILELLSDDFIINAIKENKQEIVSTVNCKTILIYPATEMHVRKYTMTKVYRCELFSEYLNDEPFAPTSWIQTVFDHANGLSVPILGEEIYYFDNDIVIIAYNKWNRNVNELYLLCLFKNSKYNSIRNLNENDLELLITVKNKIYKVVYDKFDLTSDNLCLYFHYRPTYYQLHIHIVNISKTTLCLYNCYRSILLDDVIKNITLDGNYYKKEIWSLY